MSEADKKINFLENILPRLIVERNEEFKNYKVVKCTARASTHLDGFMAAIYFVELVMKNGDGSDETHEIIAKIMKGDKDFRDRTNSSVQCSNEIYIFKNIIPYFKDLLKASKITTFNPNNWVPRIYFADYKVFNDLSDEQEAVLALENISPKGFRMGPRVDLDEAHLKLMIENIASYHAVSYAMKIRNDPMVEKFTNEMTPLHFAAPNGDNLESYNILFKIGLERVFTIFENRKNLYTNGGYVEIVEKIKEQAFERPVLVMEKLLKKDETFCVFLHGDYNRNNVMFRYEQSEGFENPRELRMIDFQETRIATPAIDLAFFMYMNTPPSIRDGIWDKLLALYHETYMKCLIDILKCDANDPRLKPYSFENFLNHFARHAFYGVMICFHFSPWLGCPTEELERISYLFENDMKSDEFRELLQVCGGKSVDDLLENILMHAYDKGYLKIFE